MKMLVGVLLLMAVVRGFAAAQGVVAGDWTVDTVTDPITDEIRTYMWATASDYPEFATNAVLIVLCDANTHRVMFLPDRYVGSDDTIEAVYRIDSREPAVVAWQILSGGERVLLPERRVAAFVRDLTVATRVAIRLTPSFSASLTYVIPVSGARTALNGLTGCT